MKQTLTIHSKTGKRKGKKPSSKSTPATITPASGPATGASASIETHTEGARERIAEQVSPNDDDRVNDDEMRNDGVEAVALPLALKPMSRVPVKLFVLRDASARMNIEGEVLIH